MRTFLVLLLHLVTSVAKLLGPGGAKALVAESLLLKRQLLIVNRGDDFHGASTVTVGAVLDVDIEYPFE